MLGQLGTIITFYSAVIAASHRKVDIVEKVKSFDRLWLDVLNDLCRIR